MIEPVGRRILVERLKEKEGTKKSNIVIPEIAKEKPHQGIVKNIAKVGKNDGPFPVKKGDKILFGKYSGTEIEFKGKEYLILIEDDILAKIG
jgi:chaperonin GroES